MKFNQQSAALFVSSSLLFTVVVVVDVVFVVVVVVVVAVFVVASGNLKICVARVLCFNAVYLEMWHQKEHDSFSFS